MISALPLLLLQLTATEVAVPSNTAEEIAYCSSDSSGQPYRFCLANRLWERGKRELQLVLPKVRISALAQRAAIIESTKYKGSPTLSGDPVAAFDLSQKLWQKSADADCGAVGLSRVVSLLSAEPVTAQLECEAQRVFARIEFLKHVYDVGD